MLPAGKVAKSSISQPLVLARGSVGLMFDRDDQRR